MKLILFLFILQTYFHFLIPQNIHISSSSQAYQNEPDKSDEPNIIKGWLKFFTFVPDFTSSDIPTKFEYNQAYREQFNHDRNPEFSLKDKDSLGYYNIPSDTSFFFVLTKKTLYVINSRRVNILTTKKIKKILNSLE